MRLCPGDIGQRQLQRIADGNPQPRLPTLPEGKPHGVGAMTLHFPALANLQVSQKRIQGMWTEPPLRETYPTVFPNFFAIVEKFLQFEIGTPRRFTAG